MQAVYKYGHVTFMDIVPDEDIAAGDVVVVGNVVGIAHGDLEAGERGALAIKGGVYYVRGIESGTAGKRLFWNTDEASGGRVTYDAASTSGERAFGLSVSDFTANGYGLALHDPDGTLSS